MNGARVFEDAYSGVFREQEDFFSCLHEIMGKSSWIRQKVRNLRLVPIVAGSTFEKELRSQYTEDGMDDGIITDTIANTALMLKYRGEMLPVRDCAIKSILDRAGIQGSGLRRVERNVYARILTILHGISIMLKGNIGGPTVYVDNFYQRFQGSNEEIEEMIDYILEDIRSCYEIDDEELQRNVYEYDRAKEHLRVALCNYEANKETLSSRPHKRILDLAVIACVRNDEAPVGRTGFIYVTDRLLEIWGVSKEEMFTTALKNTMKEAYCCKLSDLLAQQDDFELPPGVEIPLYILTTNSKYLGASSLLNGPALNQIAEELHSNLFIYPSSIHEVLVLPDEGTRKQRAMQKEMVEEVNETNVSPEERLSNSVYYFDREKQEVTIDYLGKPLSELNR